MSSRRNRVQCIIPPHVFDEIVQRGSSAQRAWALRTMAASERVRGQREALSLIRGAGLTPAGTKRRTIYDARQEDGLPGQLVRGESDGPTGDPAVDEAFEGSGDTYDFFSRVFERNSIDGEGMRLDSTVHFREGYDNAFWNGRQMVYGDGDEDLPEKERLFNRFTISLDIIAHELTHGVTQYEANLVYRRQAGALNESFSDVFGSLVKQFKRGQTVDEADWLIGAELLTDNVKGDAIRSMKEPGTAYDDPVLGKDPQPGHMKDYSQLPLWKDNGGVHIYSGIPNRAFYLTATEIGGRAWEKAGRIWYEALVGKLRSRDEFQDAANKTYQAAGELFGSGGKEQTAVLNGWGEVGIEISIRENHRGKKAK